MIFVTVGTHEQPFDRLIKEVDYLKGYGFIKDEVFIQTGFTTYEPKNCEWSSLISYEEMQFKIKEARIVITHGGPASFIAALQIGKIPIVVPRQYKFNEHINDHQVEFSEQVEKRNRNIIAIYEIENLKYSVVNYDEIANKMNSTNRTNSPLFCEGLKRILDKLIGKFSD